MKKTKFLLMILLLVFAFPLLAKADTKKIKVYMFRGEGCPHCEEALTFFDSLSNDEEYSKYYELVTYEVWNDEDNANLMKEVADAYGEQASGVPYIIIGEKTFSGYSSSSDDQIKSAIKTAYENEDYEDIVKEVKNGTYKKESTSIPVLPIIIISVVAIVVVIGLVMFTKEKE